MSKNLVNTTVARKVNDDTACTVAELYGVSKRYVNMVIRGERVNEKILISYMQLKEGKNMLLEAVKRAISF